MHVTVKLLSQALVQSFGFILAFIITKLNVTHTHTHTGTDYV